LATVSVIIPTYNHARFVCQAIESVLSQTYRDFEVIVVDDGSTDETQNLLKSFKDKIISIYQPNKGLSAARNTGLFASTGSLLLFLDADDLITPDRLARQVPVFQSTPGLGVVYSAWQNIDEYGSILLGASRPRKQGPVLKDLIRRTFFFPPGSALVLRECFDTLGCFDEKLRAAEDMDMWVRIAAAGYQFGYIDEILFYYRIVLGSMSRNLENQSKNEFARLDKFFSDTDLDEDVRRLREDAYAIIHYEYCTKYLSVGKIDLARDHLIQAIKTQPGLIDDKEWILEWISGFVMNPEIKEPHQLINQLFDNLPQEAEALKPLRRRAHGRYHAALAFSEYYNRNYNKVYKQLLPVILYDPKMLINRGFLKICCNSLLKKYELNKSDRLWSRSAK
jgi:glycosyltransferase involved in cell wall biosynthesis